MARSGAARHDRSRRDESGPTCGSTPRLEVGIGRAIAHHGELLQGVFEGADGRLHRGLLTLPLPSKQVVATFWPRDDGRIRTRPTNRPKAGRATALTLQHIGINERGGDVTIESRIPTGHGYGSSTADVVAAIRATAAASNITLRRSTTCRLAVAAEGASDAVTYDDHPVLFAHREGFIIEHLGDEFPPLLVVGFRDGGAVPIDTLHLQRARYDSEEIEIFRVLRGLAYRAIGQHDPQMLGRVATISAQISQRHLPKRHWNAVLQLLQEYGALGVQVAHSGTLFGILIDPERPKATKDAASLAKILKSDGFKGVEIFALNAEGAFP